MKRNIVILGPTCTGKTETAVVLARRMDAEIISSDSMQIYKGMDIGTSKPSVDEMQNVRHHLLSYVSPSEKFDVAMFVRDARLKISEIRSRGKNVIITGGTGMYLRGLVEGILVQENDDTPFRKQIEAEIAEKGIDYVREKLRHADPEKYKILPENDHRRIVRALAFYKANSQKTISSMQKEWDNSDTDDFLMLGLTMDRSILYERINSRVDRMIQKGFIDEVKNLISLNIPEDSTCWQAIGYKHLLRHVLENLPLEKACELIKRDTRRYAKRQLTWFKRLDKIKWFQADDLKRTAEEIMAYISNSETAGQ